MDNLNCNNCGAALLAPGRDGLTRCRYCGTQHSFPTMVVPEPPVIVQVVQPRPQPRPVYHGPSLAELEEARLQTIRRKEQEKTNIKVLSFLVVSSGLWLVMMLFSQTLIQRLNLGMDTTSICVGVACLVSLFTALLVPTAGLLAISRMEKKA